MIDRMMGSRATAVIVLLGVACLAAPVAQERPLPELEPFLAEVRTRLRELGAYDVERRAA